MRKLGLVLSAFAVLAGVSSCSSVYSEAIVGKWTYSYVSRHSDMTKDECAVNWTFHRGGDKPQFVETRQWDVEYNGVDGAEIHCKCTSKVKGTYYIALGLLMLEYDVSTLSVNAFPREVTVSGGRYKKKDYGYFTMEYDKDELSDEVKHDVYRWLFTFYQEFNDTGSILISDITDRTFVFEDVDIGTVTAYRQ